MTQLRGTASNKELTHKVNALAKQIRHKGELKCKQIAASVTVLNGTITTWNLNDIGQGDSISQREGQTIRVEKVEVSGHVDNHRADMYICRAPGDDTPLYTHFTPQRGGLVDVVFSQSLKILRHIRNYLGSNGNFKSQYKYGYPCKIGRAHV